ncbi:MLO-like protein 4 [Impatiens glandulifera]|uniref:MLO-like protein 4 n=1 Tax=Impatiens glandulifera TaxID=253017 RepID=UPI001FB11D77|nr:MLO-like protein 4 [Impatiens glandulifera]
MRIDGERSLFETPTWAVATVVSVMVTMGFLFHGSLKRLGKWLDRTKRKALLSALEKIKEELMLFGLLSLLMGHWTIFVAKICVKSSSLSSRFYPCLAETENVSVKHITVETHNLFNNHSRSQQHVNHMHTNICPEGHDFASYESLEQLHRFLFVLGITHILYSFFAIALAMIKIYGWRKWENQAKQQQMAISQAAAAEQDEGSTNTSSVKSISKMRRQSTFIFHQTSHPWSQHRALVWLLCFSRQFWSSINRADYMALRLGFISMHQLPLSYDFHNYILRSMEEEFRDIVGISIPLWIFAILCIFLGFHGTNFYFWSSFLPAILILAMGTKLHRIVVKLAVETMDSPPFTGSAQRFNLRDELFWFGRPRLLLWLIQFVSFQNAFEMALFIWSMWESRGPSCFMEKKSFIVIRLTFGVVSQFWCSFITFPLYVIVTQMGSRFKKTIISENVRKSLHGWRGRVKARHPTGSPPFVQLHATTSITSLESMTTDHEINEETNSSSSKVVNDIDQMSSRFHQNAFVATHRGDDDENLVMAFDDHDNKEEEDDDDEKKSQHKDDFCVECPP